MKLQSILVLSMLFSNVLFGQKGCSDALFLHDSSQVVGGIHGDVWIKFKAKGKVLNLKVTSVIGDVQLPYEIYPSTSCKVVNEGLLRPTRTFGTEQYVLTQELWQETIDKGLCVCDNCLSKVKLSPNRNLQMQQEKMYLLKVHGNGKKVKITSKWTEIDKSKKIFELNADLENLEVGMKFQLKMVQFVASKTVYLNKGTPKELDSLFQFLNKSKSMKVIIVGHVNGPTNYNIEHFHQLSSARAKKIRDYLIGRGIDKSRVASVGKSNTEMRYPSPKTEWEAQQNRRVEVEIVSL